MLKSGKLILVFTRHCALRLQLVIVASSTGVRSFWQEGDMSHFSRNRKCIMIYRIAISKWYNFFYHLHFCTTYPEDALAIVGKLPNLRRRSSNPEFKLFQPPTRKPLSQPIPYYGCMSISSPLHIFCKLNLPFKPTISLDLCANALVFYSVKELIIS